MKKLTNEEMRSVEGGSALLGGLIAAFVSLALGNIGIFHAANALDRASRNRYGQR